MRQRFEGGELYNETEKKKKNKAAERVMRVNWKRTWDEKEKRMEKKSDGKDKGRQK